MNEVIFKGALDVGNLIEGLLGEFYCGHVLDQPPTRETLSRWLRDLHTASCAIDNVIAECYREKHPDDPRPNDELAEEARGYLRLPSEAQWRRIADEHYREHGGDC